MNIELEYIPEPKLQFGHYFEHEDTKTGLAEYGPFGKNIDGLHPTEVRLYRHSGDHRRLPGVGRTVWPAH